MGEFGHLSVAQPPVGLTLARTAMEQRRSTTRGSALFPNAVSFVQPNNFIGGKRWDHFNFFLGFLSQHPRRLTEEFRG
jgi:hypothetical protein